MKRKNISLERAYVRKYKLVVLEIGEILLNRYLYPSESLYRAKRSKNITPLRSLDLLCKSKEIIEEEIFYKSRYF